MGKKRVQFMVTAFRDGFQSAYGARVFTKDFLPAVEAACRAGINHFEVGGGAMFQSLYFYCNEDAFTSMDSVRATTGPDADLQTLARGINVVGLDSQPRDIIRLHAQLFKKHGITTIRNFDALNDVHNLDYSGRCIVEAGLRHEVCVTMMELPPGCSGSHTAEYYLQVLTDILDAQIPFDSVCFKDASGTSTPAKVYETIRLARKHLGAQQPLRFHTHETAGTSVLAYKAALDAGADAIDLSLAPVSGGTCQPDVVAMWHALRGTEFDLGIDVYKILEAEEVFKECMKDYFLLPEAVRVEPLIPFSPMPGGALTANTQMMRDSGILDKYPQVIAAMGEVVARGGFGTSVTPVSQFYFQQAFNNAVLGPWKKIVDGYGKMVLGYFGKTPTAPDPEIVRLASEQLGLPPTTRSPLEINDEDPKKGIAAGRRLLAAAGLPETDENIFIAATCLEKGVAFLKGEARIGVRKHGDAPASAPAAAASAPAAASGPAAASAQTAAAAKPAAAAAPASAAVLAPVPGRLIRLSVREGQAVIKGQVLAAVEFMGMENEVLAPRDGTVARLSVQEGQAVRKQEQIAQIA